MPTITGRDVSVAYEQTSSTWGTAVAPTTGDGIHVTSVGPLVPVSEMHPEESSGYSYHTSIPACRIVSNPEIKIQPRFSGREWSFIAQLFGLDTKSGTGDPYTHTITWVQDIDLSDKFGTLCVLVSTLLHEWPSVKPIGFTLEGPNDKGYLDLTIRTIADCCKLGADCTTTTTDMGNVTYMAISTAIAPMIPYGCLRFRINTGADALDADDNLLIQRFSLSIDRGFSPEWVNRQGSYADAWKSGEPMESGIPQMTFSMTVGDYTALTWNEAFQDNATYKAQLYFYLSANHQITIDLPLLRVMPPEISYDGPGRIPQVVNFNVMKASANPTGMTSTLPNIIIADPNASAYE